MTDKTITTPQSVMISDGKKFQNFSVTAQGNLKTIEPFCDGLLVSYIYDEDDNGNPFLRPIMSTICKTEKFSELLTQAAHKLFHYMESIPLPVRNP